VDINGKLNSWEAVALLPFIAEAELLCAIRGGGGRARSHCRSVLSLIHSTPELLIYSVPLSLKRQCDRTLGGGGGLTADEEARDELRPPLLLEYRPEPGAAVACRAFALPAHGSHRPCLLPGAALRPSVAEVRKTPSLVRSWANFRPL
jgi:hypothetical protein